MTDSAPGANFERLIERSSLGTEGAKSLRRRTTEEQAQALQRLARLRDSHRRGLTDDLELGRLLEEVGALDEAASFYGAVAARALHRLAAVRGRQGQDQAAAAWTTRARTLE